MPGKWEPAPNAGTWQVALQSQLGVKGCVMEAIPLSDLWKNLGRSNGVWADWAARFADYGTSRSAEDKDRLPAINVSTICDSRRRTSNVISHTGLIVIDFDHAHNAPVLAGEIRRCEHVMGDFVSPSGNGVKAIIPVNPIPSSAGDHRSAYFAVKDALEDYIANCTTKYQYEIDESGKDPVRLMFAYSHTPSRVGLSREAVPVQWKPKEIPPAYADVSRDPVELDEFLACASVLDLGKHKSWLPARGASITQGLTFDEWDVIAQNNAGYEGREDQRRKWDHDVKHGNRIPARTIFVLAKKQGLKPADWRKHMIKPKPYTSISEGRKAPKGGKAPVTDGKRSKPKETASTGDKSDTFGIAEAFIKHCNESDRPYRFRTANIWMHYGEHGWEIDPREVHIRARLARWVKSPAGVAINAPLAANSRRAIIGDAETLCWHNQWDETEAIGLPNREVLVVNADGLLEKEKGNPLHYISKRTGAPVGSLDKDMADLWTTCVEQWMEDDDVRFYVQVLLGAALLGRAVETRSVLYIQSGSGFGKSTFIDAVRSAFGDYAASANAATFMNQHGTRHLTEIAQLMGARLVTTAELPQNGQWNTARIKELSGGEVTVANRMHKDMEEFRPQFLLLLSGNHDPKLMGGDSEGFKQRLRLVRWSKRGFTKPDPRLKDKLASDSGKATIVQWLVNGAEHYAQDGLPDMPETMRQDLDTYIENHDWFEAFKKTLELDPSYFTSNVDLKKHYDKWAEEADIPSDHRKGMPALKKLFIRLPGCRPARPRINGRQPRGFTGVRPIDSSLDVLDYTT